MNIRKIIKEEVDSFDWVNEVPLPDISLGTKIKTTTGNIYTVVSTNDKSIFYTIEKGPQIDKSNRIGSIEYDTAKDLVDRGRWKIIKEEVDSFDWMDTRGIRENVCVKRYSGVLDIPGSTEGITYVNVKNTTLRLYSVMNTKDIYNIVSVTKNQVGIQGKGRLHYVSMDNVENWVKMGLITYCDGEKISL